MPSGEGASFEVVESELSLELLIAALGLPTLLDDADDLFLAHATPQTREEEFRRFALSLWPFDDEPDRLAQLRLAAVVVRGLDSAEDEARRELSTRTRTVAPRDLSERALTDVDTEVAYVDGVSATMALRIEQPDAGIGIDGDGVVESIHAHDVAKDVRASVEAVGQNDLTRHLIIDRARNQIERQLDFRLEDDRLGDSRSRTPRRIARPRLGQIQLHVDRHLLTGGSDAETDGQLAVGDFSGTAGVLPLHARRVPTLFEHPCVVDDPTRHRLARAQGIDDVTRRLAPNESIAPCSLAHEVEKPIVDSLTLRFVAACARRDRLYALAIAVGENAKRVRCERRTLIASAKMLANRHIEVLRDSCRARLVHFVAHGRKAARRSSKRTTSRSRYSYKRIIRWGERLPATRRSRACRRDLQQ